MQMNEGTHVAKLRIRAAEDNPAVRLAVTSQLRAMKLQPQGLPPSSVLLVRHLADPAPGRLLGKNGAPTASLHWQQKAQIHISELLKGAVRPVNGRLDSGRHDAIVFRDWSELLACAARTLATGPPVTEWWWKLLSRYLSDCALADLKSLLVAEPESIPAVFATLQQWGISGLVIERLGVGDARAVLACLISNFDLPLSISEPSEQHDQVNIDQASVSAKTHFTQRSSDSEEQLLPRPWRKWLSQTGPSLEQEALHGLALSLANAPARTRAPVFIAEFGHWWRSVSARTVGDSASQQRTSDSKRQASQRHKQITGVIPLNEVVPDTNRPPDPVAVQATEESFLLHRFESRNSGRTAPLEQQTVSAQVQIDIGPTADLRTTDLGESTDGQEADGSELTTHRLADTVQNSSITEDGIVTSLGGLLYLINVMSYFELPQCFEQDWGMASQLGGWGTLELLGRALLDDPELDDSIDPLWDVLAHLDGRVDKEPLGGEFVAPGTYRLPDMWWKKIDMGHDYRWSARCNRLRLWSNTGVILVDRECAGSAPFELAQSELASYGNRTAKLTRAPFDSAPLAAKGPMLNTINPVLAQFVCHFSQTLRNTFFDSRLHRDGDTPEVTPSELFHSKSTIYVTRTTVDAVAPLAAASIHARRAGLDRNPGWCPALGRIVTFHFE